VKDKQRCCKCGPKNVRFAQEHAGEFNGQAEMEPSFMEMVASFTHAAQNGVEECCPCKGRK
jgi:hypothetical protein